MPGTQHEPKHVIVLTAGLAGSSLVAGLVARAGYNTGAATFRKNDYDTFENQALIELNQAILAATGVDIDYTRELCGWAADRVRNRADRVQTAPLQDFVASCNQMGPWLWKDPRLWMTLAVWLPLLDLDQTRFVMVSRSPLEAWLSALSRRHVQSYAYTKEYNRQVEMALVQCLSDHALPWLDVDYDQLLLDPGRNLQRLNTFLGTSLMIEDLQSVSRLKLYRRPRTARATARSLAIYLKNFRQRVDIR